MSILNSYKKLNKVYGIKSKLSAYVPSPKDTDYTKGYIKRYFAQKANDKFSPVIEISSETSSRLTSNSLYRTVNLRWRIRGPLKMMFKDDGSISDKGVEESNRKSIELVSKKMPALKLYLVHLLQFYKE
jgi:hypothetical protein